MATNQGDSGSDFENIVATNQGYSGSEFEDDFASNHGGSDSDFEDLDYMPLTRGGPLMHELYKIICLAVKFE